MQVDLYMYGENPAKGNGRVTNCSSEASFSFSTPESFALTPLGTFDPRPCSPSIMLAKVAMSTNAHGGCRDHSWDALTSLYYFWPNTQRTLIRSVRWHAEAHLAHTLPPSRMVAMARWVCRDPSAPAKPALTAARRSEAVAVSHMGAECLRLKKKKKP